MPQADGYVRIVTQNDTSEAQRSTEQLGSTIAGAMDTSPVDRMTQAMTGLEQSLGNTDTSGIDGVRDGIDGVGSAAISTGDLIKANLISDVVMQGVQQLSTALKDAAEYTIGTADDLDKSVKKVVSATGAGADGIERLENVIRQVYKDNFGQGFEDIADSIALIEQNLGRLEDTELITVTEDAYALLDVFDMTVEESSRAAKAMMQNFSISAAKAYDYIAKGAQDGLNYSGELLDSIREYSVQFAKMGLSADDMFNIFAAGAESGAWNLDKVGDAIKEMSIRVIDGSDSTAKGFEKIGLNADAMAQRFGQGGDTARKAFSETLKALSELDDPLAQDAAGVALLGTMWEDLGSDAVSALADISDSAYVCAGAMNGIKEMNYSGLSDHLDTVKKKIDLLIEPIGEALIPAIDEAADTIDEILDSGDIKETAEDIGEFVSGTLTLLLKNIKLIASAVTGVTSAFIAFKTAAVLTKVIASWQTAALQVKLFTASQGAAALQTAATNGTLTTQEVIFAALSGRLDVATIKQYGLNTAMSLNPAGLVAAAVGLLATALTGYALCAGETTDAVEELNTSLQDMKNSIHDNLTTGAAEIKQLQEKAARYEELRSSLGRTSAEQKELNSLAGELQNILGDEISVVNSLTGEYNDLSAAIEGYIGKRKQEIMLSAYEEQALEAQKKIIETQREIENVMAQQTAAYNMTHGNGWLIDIAYAAGAGKITDDEYNRKIAELEAIKGEYQDIVDTYFDKLTDSYETAPVKSSGSGTADNERAKGEALLRKQAEAAAALEKQYVEYAEMFRQEQKDLRYQYDMGVIDAAGYYSRLTALRDKYLKPDSDQWRDVSVEIKSYYDSLSEEQKKAYEKQLTEQKKAADEAVKARTAAYNEEKSQLQFRLKTNQMTEKKYYAELAKIRDKYLDKNTSEWRSAYLEAYQYNQQILQNNKDTLTQLITDASDTTLSALENITAARNSLASKLTDFNKTFEKITETVPETIAVKGDFTITTAAHEVEAYRMGADSIEDNIRILEEYGAMLEALRTRGADEMTMNDILGMDIEEGMKYGSQLLKLSEKEWDGYFDSMARLRQTAEDISAKYYQNEVESLKENFVDKLRSELEGLGSDMYKVGADVAAEFVSGWNEALGTHDLTLGEIMRAVAGGTLDTAPKAAQQLTAAGNAAATAETAPAKTSSTVHAPIYIGSKKIADILIDAANGKIVQTGKNVLLT